jgi:cytochrome-b5 reductase
MHHQVGYVDFVIKVYFPNSHPKFPEGGKMSHHLAKLSIGDTVDMMGPKGKLEYKVSAAHYAASTVRQW